MPKYYIVEKTGELELLTQEINKLQVRKVAAWGYQKRKAQVLSGYTRRSG